MSRQRRWSITGEVVNRATPPAVPAMQPPLPLPVEPLVALTAAGWYVVAVGGPHRDPPHWLGGRARHWVSGVEVAAEGPTLEAVYAALWEQAEQEEARV